MRSLKNHLSFIIPLFAILFAVEFYLIVEKIIANYEKSLSQDYSIVVVSEKPLNIETIKSRVPAVSRSQEVNGSLIIKRLKKEGLDVDFKTLELFLPKFYKIYLASYPSDEYLKKIKKELLAIDGVVRVETFAKVHERIYAFLLFLKNMSKFFLFIIFLISVMLIFKQIEIWHLEHSERMYIMALFGAPLWMRNAILIKLSFLDTIIATGLVFGIYYYLISSHYIQKILGVHTTIVTVQELLGNMVWLLGLGLAISLFTIIVIASKEPKV